MHVTPAPGDAVGSSAETSHRRLLVDGVVWSVRLYTWPYDRRGAPDLLFESDAVVRRVRDYPQDWYALRADVLFALSLQV